MQGEECDSFSSMYSHSCTMEKVGFKKGFEGSPLGDNMQVSNCAPDAGICRCQGPRKTQGPCKCLHVDLLSISRTFIVNRYGAWSFSCLPFCSRVAATGKITLYNRGPRIFHDCKILLYLKAFEF